MREKGDLRRVHRNPDPALRPMERATEAKRALNAAKLDRIFARPLVAGLEGHADGVTALARSPARLNSVLSGDAAGEVLLWDVPERRTLVRMAAHRGAVTGLSVSRGGEVGVSCGADGVARLWRLPVAERLGSRQEARENQALAEFRAGGGMRGVDHHWGRAEFATVGDGVDVWAHGRAEPLRHFEWGADSVTSARFNPVEQDLFASTGGDRSLALYDLRMGTPLRKLVMQTRSNALAWNPIEAFNFTVANEDCNLYSYDMRKLDRALCVHQDHVSSVMDVDYAPTGREFVSGSYDRTIRIFPYNGGHSREVYHTKRMQRVFAVRFSGDASYVLSGSDDMNLRVWKAAASERMGVVLPRERSKQAYDKALLKRFKDMPEVKRIARHRHLPQAVYKTARLRRTMTNAEKRKEHNVIAHSTPGSVKPKQARKKKIVRQLD